MKSLGAIDMQGNELRNITLEEVNEWPLEPKVGSFIFKDKRLMYCVELSGGMPIWIPLSQEMDTYQHSQTESAVTWTVPHNLNTSTAMVQCFDENNGVIIPDSIDMSAVDTAVLSFSLPIAGRAIVMLGRMDGMPKPDIQHTQAFSSSIEWVITHGLGYSPVVRCYVGNYEVQPASIVHDTPTQTTVTFSDPTAGRVVCL